MTTAAIAFPAPDPTYAIEVITPERAHEFLALNTHNRPRKGQQVAAIARDIANGAWVNTGHPAVTIGSNNVLLDGQHTMQAIIEAGVPIRATVCRNVHPAAQRVMDSGSKRHVRDDLSMSGMRHASRVASAARYAMLRENESHAADTRHAKVTFTNSEVHDYIAAHPDLVASVQRLGSVNKRIFLPDSVVHVVYWLLSQIDADDAERFFNDLLGGVRRGDGDPMVALDNRLAMVQRARLRVPQEQAYSALIRTWNAWRRGTKVSRLALVESGRMVPAPEAI